jgi:hypothetical protein
METIERLVKFAEECNTFPNSLSVKWTRIGSKNLYISQRMRSRYYLIKSYQTIVGIVDEDTFTFLEMGKYSPTTSRQISFIYKDKFSYCDRLFTDRKVA